jgi:hypothetical protein
MENLQRQHTSLKMRTTRLVAVPSMEMKPRLRGGVRVWMGITLVKGLGVRVRGFIIAGDWEKV